MDVGRVMLTNKRETIFPWWMWVIAGLCILIPSLIGGPQ